MKKYEIVKSSREFDQILKNGKVVKNKEFVIYFMDNSKEIPRFGISVGKKIGNAVIRNYYKRIIRNICDNNKKNYSKGKDYIIIMRKRCIELSYTMINDSMLSLINQMNSEKEK